jgi:hypothetical protein
MTCQSLEISAKSTRVWDYPSAASRQRPEEITAGRDRRDYLPSVIDWVMCGQQIDRQRVEIIGIEFPDKSCSTVDKAASPAAIDQLPSFSDENGIPSMIGGFCILRLIST